MESSKITNRITIEEAAGQMMSFETGHRGPISWSEALRIDASRNIIGEIRTLDDWDSLPRDVQFRAIYLIDDKGPVIRWGNTHTMHKVLPGNLHDHLVCESDELTQAKSGWIIVSKNGELSVRS